MQLFMMWIPSSRRASVACAQAATGRLISFVVAGLMAFGVVLAGQAPAGAETRSLKLYNTHTQESATITFKRNGGFDANGLKKLNWFLRDWRRDEKTKMDPALFDIIWNIYRQTGASQPIYVVSGYRSPVTNNMLRQRSRGVAKASQHTLGKAMDFYIPGVSLSKIRETALKLQQGGVGFYPTSGSPFVHVDTGNVRHWPRMTRQQLVRLFPDGKTLHLPSDGKPLSGYQLALAAQKAGKLGSSSSRLAYASASDDGSKSRGKSKGLLAALFQSGESDDEEIAAATVRPGKRPQQELRAYPNAPTPPPAAEAPEPEPAPAPAAAVPTPEIKPAMAAPPAPEPAPPAAVEPEKAPEQATGSMLIASAPVPMAKPKAVVVASAAPVASDPTKARAADGTTLQWNTGPSSAPVAAAVPMPASPTATEAATTPTMLLAMNEVRLPLAKPGAAHIAAAATPDVGTPASPMPPEKPLIVSSIAGTRGSVQIPAVPSVPSLPAFAPATQNSAVNAANALASGNLPTAPATPHAVVTQRSAPTVASEYRRSATSHLLAYNGTDISQLTAKSSARTKVLASMKAPNVLAKSEVVFETPLQAIDNSFGRGVDNGLRTDRFSGTAYGRINTVWLGFGQR